MKKYGKIWKNSFCPQFGTNNLFTATAVLQHFGTENNAGQVTVT